MLGKSGLHYCGKSLAYPNDTIVFIKRRFPVNLYTGLPEVWDRAELLQRIEIRHFWGNREKCRILKDFQGNQFLKRRGEFFLGEGVIVFHLCFNLKKSLSGRLQ